MNIIVYVQYISKVFFDNLMMVIIVNHKYIVNHNGLNLSNYNYLIHNGYYL